MIRIIYKCDFELIDNNVQLICNKIQLVSQQFESETYINFLKWLAKEYANYRFFFLERHVCLETLDKLGADNCMPSWHPFINIVKSYMDIYGATKTFHLVSRNLLEFNQK